MSRRKDELFNKLDTLKPPDTVTVETPEERNRALQFGRRRGMLFFSRFQKPGEIKIWRVA